MLDYSAFVFRYLVLALFIVIYCAQTALTFSREYCAISPKGPVRYSSHTMA